MSEVGGRSIRGRRPGWYGMSDDECDEAEVVRLANVEAYARRVRAGLPVFEDSGDSLGRLRTGSTS